MKLIFCPLKYFKGNEETEYIVHHDKKGAKKPRREWKTENRSF
jgi:hypothetical protein